MISLKGDDIWVAAKRGLGPSWPFTVTFNDQNVLGLDSKGAPCGFRKGVGVFSGRYSDSQRTNVPAAIKIEEIKSNMINQIRCDIASLCSLHDSGVEGIPEALAYSPGVHFQGKRVILSATRLLGPSLGQLVETSPSATFDTMLTLAASALTVLSQVASCGWLHRDIKPSNFVFAVDQTSLTSVSDDQSLYLIDFGVARQLSKVAHESRVCEGTDSYMAVAVHQRLQWSFDPLRDDVEALGYVLLAVMQRLPWSGVHNEAELVRHKLAVLDNVLDPSMKAFLHEYFAIVNQGAVNVATFTSLLKLVNESRMQKSGPKGGLSSWLSSWWSGPAAPPSPSPPPVKRRKEEPVAMRTRGRKKMRD